MASIVKKGKKYYPVVYLGRDDNGKQILKWGPGFDTEPKARKAGYEMEAQKGNGTLRPTRPTTFSEFILEWRTNKKQEVREGTMRQYNWLIDKYLIPELGKLLLNKIEPVRIQRMYRKLEAKGLARQSIIATHRILKQALDVAVQWSLIFQNPCSSVKPPKPLRAPSQYWNEDELNRFLDAIVDERYYVAILLAASTGLRIGELLALTWSDIDMDKGTIQVSKAYVAQLKGYDLAPTKTAKGTRILPVAPSITDALRVHKVKQAEERLKAGALWTDNGLVICTHTGGYVLQHNMRETFYRYIKKAQVPKIRFHDLRHTHASLLLKLGTHPKVVQERLGHSDIQTTLNTYSHIMPGIQEAAAQSFDQLLAKHHGEKNGSERNFRKS